MLDGLFYLAVAIVLGVFIIFIIASAGYDAGTSAVAEFACLEQGYDTGEWVDGAIQCITHGTIGGG